MLYFIFLFDLNFELLLNFLIKLLIDLILVAQELMGRNWDLFLLSISFLDGFLFLLLSDLFSSGFLKSL